MPLHLNARREWTLLGAAAGLLGLAVYLDHCARTPVRIGDLRNPYAGSRNPLDALAFTTPDVRAAKMADAGLYGGPALPLLLVWHPRLRPHYRTLLVVWLEGALLTFSATSVIKNLTNRPRPYVIAGHHPAGDPLSRNDRAAFLSGHAALAMFGGLLFARLTKLYLPGTRWTIFGYFMAGAVPGFTAYLRVRGAKHWPTDVVAGLLLGAAVTATVVALHEEK